MNLVDDCTVYPWTFPLRSKSDALPTLQTWARRIEAETGERIGEFRFDGGELDSNALREWCDEQGYQFSLSAAHTSAHIGRVERMHRTIMNKARAMRLESGLPPFLWDEFALTASYLSARTFSRSIGTTPYESWHKQKPDLSHLREIGCRAFVLVQNHHNPKIYARSFECVLIGYATNAKAYRLYHRDTNRIIQSYHVEFIERHDNSPSPLFPGRIIGADSQTTSQTTSPRRPHASIEDEDDADAPCVPDPTIPLVPIIVPADETTRNLLPPPPIPTPPAAVPVPVPPPVPPPVAAEQPRRSSRISAPSYWRPLMNGVQSLSRTDRAVAESREATRRLKELQDTARDERRRAVVEVRQALTDPNPPTISPAGSDVDLAAILTDLSTLNDSDVCIFNEALAAVLASGAINTDFPDDPVTLKEVLDSPDAPAWRASILDELKSLHDMGVYKLVPRSSIPSGRKALRSKWVFRLKRDEAGRPA